MGNCAGSNTNTQSATDLEEQRAISKAIDVQIQKQKYESKETKLLLLGPGDAGKSTILKQVKIIHVAGFSDDERREYKPIVYSNVITSMKQMVDSLFEVGDIDALPEICQKHAQVLQPKEVLDLKELTPEITKAIQVLWAEKTFRIRFKETHESLHISENVAFFFQEFDRIRAPTYLPTDIDILFARVRTIGISELPFSIGNDSIRLVDVGGQRSERRKWVHCFQDVTAILFCASLSEYDQRLREDQKRNRMLESLTLFDEICNSKWFVNTPMILFLNKSDLFREKLKITSLTILFPEYNGDSFETATSFLAKKFIAKNQNHNKSVYTHITCATNTENIRFVFNAVKDVLLKQNIEQIGL